MIKISQSYWLKNRELDKHARRFHELICLLKGRFNQSKSLIPEPQLYQIEHNPSLNPRLVPKPKKFFFESFDGWFIVLDLIPGGKYGPFYRVDGDHFWPRHSDGNNPRSEAKYFYGLKKPKTQKEAKEMYAPQATTSITHVHELDFDENIIYGAQIYLGPVRGGSGYQFNANIPAANMIRSLIIREKIGKEELPE